MADSFNVWPSGVPVTYSGESFPLPKTESLPALYGIDLTNPFFLSFLAGGAFVAFFSIARFNRRSHDPTDPVTAESKLLERLTPADLRDGRLIAQAYMLYVSVLLGIYAALTFYGRIVLDWVNNVLPTAGYTDTRNFDFSSPQWPLMVALAMVGVMPVLPPVEAVEVRLRHWTHRVVGIPLTIYRHSEAMRGQLRRLRGVKPGELPDYASEIPPWVNDIADPFSINYAFEARDDLRRLTPWTMTGRGEWPTGETNRAVEALFDEHTATARRALLDFDEHVIKRNVALPREANGAGVAERRARHVASLRTSWEQASKQVIDARDELLALLAIGAEKQSDYGLVESPDLKRLLTDAIPVDGFQRGPQVSVALLLPPLLLFFAFAIRFGWHSPQIGRYSLSFSIVSFSALFEILLIVVLFLLPLMAALNYRFWRKQAYRGRWQELQVLNFEQRGMVQVLVAGLLAFVVSFVFLALLAIAQAGILARSSRHFTRLLLEQGLPLLHVTVSLAGVSVIYCLMVLFAVEEKERGASRATLAGMGLVCALAILGYQMLHLFFWYAGTPLWCGPIFLELVRADYCPQDRPSAQAFSQYYNLVSILTNTLIGFVSIACFLPDRRGARTDPAPPPPKPRAARSPVLPAASGVVVGLVLAAIASAAIGQETGGRDVVVGFRADAPPFSSVKRIGGEVRYDGYLVDLCSRIFADDRGERYRMVKTQVTADDRFARLLRDPADRWQPGTPTESAKVDLLCDPVTLRYASEADEPYGARRTDGVFSPIVFVTGASYLERSQGGIGTPVLGLVAGTTTRKVVLQACERDAFREREKDGTQSDASAIGACGRELKLGEDRFRRSLDTVAYMQRRGRAYPARDGPVCSDLPGPAVAGGAKASHYRFCIFRDHTSAARWFCSASQEEAVYYFGDKDLILGQVEALEQVGGCDGVNPDGPFYSYEPYALLLSPVDSALVRFVQRRIYEIFSDRSEALGLFASNFEGKAMSVPLANLFLLNGVEDEADNARRAALEAP